MGELIRICTFENNDLFPVEEISRTKYEKIKIDCDLLSHSYNQFIVYKYLNINLLEFKKCCDSMSNYPVTKLNLDINRNLDLLLFLNKVIFNALSSFNFFVDNGAKYLKRKFRSNEEIIEKYNKLTNDLYDQNFAYRFLWKLRHYYIHLGFPLVALNFEAEMSEEKPEAALGEIKLELYTEMLILEADIFKKSICEEIKQFGYTIDLKPQINSLEKFGNEIQNYIYECQKNELTEAIENIEFIFGKYKTEKNSLKITLNQKEDGTRHTMEMANIPYDIIAEYKNIYSIE